MWSGKRSVEVDGQRLRKLRASLGLTQEDVAHHSGFSDRFIRKLERGGPISRSALRVVLEAYQRLSPTDLAISSSHFVASAHGELADAVAEKWLRLALRGWDAITADQILHPAVKLATDTKHYRGHAAIRTRYEDLRQATGPLRPRIDHLLTAGSRAAIYWTAKRHAAGAEPRDASEDRRRPLSGSWLLKFEDTRIRSIREHSNLHRLLKRSGRSL